MMEFIHKYYTAIFWLFLVVIIGLSVYLGYQEGKRAGRDNSIVFSCPDSILEKQRIPLPSQEKMVTTDSSSFTTTSPSDAQEGAFLGSKNGTKYYTPGCTASKRIKPENVIWFQTAQDATLQGYSKGSC